MGLFDAIDIAASGLSAESTRMNVTAENLANAETTSSSSGGPYVRKEVVLQQVGGTFDDTLATAMSASAAPAGGVEATEIVNDPTPGQKVYDPGNPAANSTGYVTMPNVNPVTEMTDLIDEQNSYASDVTAMQTAKSMFTTTLGLLK
jgi:flagellar basal-body rod protein FlgC